MNGDQRAKVRLGRVQTWQRLRMLSARTARRLKASEILFWMALWLDNFPLLGPWLLHWLGNSAYRRHLGALARRPSYRKRAIDAWRQVDLEDWQVVGRTPAGRANRLAGSSSRYLAEKFTLGWLPVWFHRLLADPLARRRFIQENLGLPLDLCLREAKRREWLCDVIEKQRIRGLVRCGKSKRIMRASERSTFAGLCTRSWLQPGVGSFF